MYPKPKPHFPFHYPRLPERPKRVTLIGAFKCPGGVVLLADRQETISDYAKWDVGKIAHIEMEGHYRFFMSGAGDPDTIDMIKERVIDEWVKIPESTARSLSAADLKTLIVRVVATTTKKCIFPFPRRDRPIVSLIWAIQQIANTGPGSIELFRTAGLAVNTIKKLRFDGNPLLLTQYLSDLYLERIILSLEDAEAIAAYFLWEAKEYDPSVGKHSDIFTLRDDGTVSRLDRTDEAYWEEHFRQFKKAIKLLPLLSCSTGITLHTFPLKLELGQLNAAIKTLSSEQQKMRRQTKKSRSSLESKLTKNMQKEARKFFKQRQSTSRT
jgi:20S proteasome alpha/beta subunit